MKNNIDWSKQHCGIIHGEYEDVINNMPDLKELLLSFPENPNDYIWDVKVHMLFPNQFPCIPGWHQDMVPRNEDMKEDYSKITPEYPMYLWLSGSPLTIFRDNEGNEKEINPQEWYKFTQEDVHRGQMSDKFTWRGLIRATHKKLNIKSSKVNNPFENKNILRRHSQVYLDSEKFKW